MYSIGAARMAAVLYAGMMPAVLYAARMAALLCLRSLMAAVLSIGYGRPVECSEPGLLQVAE